MTIGRWDVYLEHRAPSAWASLAAGFGLIFASVRLAWGLQGQVHTLESLFAQLLPSMIGGVAVGLMVFGVMRFRISDHDRRLQRMEEHKVEKELFVSELRGITSRLDDVNRVLNNVVMDLIDRLDRRSQDVSR